jgi:hypothetical protein
LLVGSSPYGALEVSIEGTFIRKGNGSWEFNGELKELDDKYNFDEGRHRTEFNEFLTSLGRGMQGEEYWLEFDGSLRLHFEGEGKGFKDVLPDDLFIV